MAGCAPGARPATPSRERRRERDPCGEAGAPSPLRFGADESGASIDRRTRRLIGAPNARGPNSAAGRRGRRRSAYEAPRAAADRGTPLGGAESKRRRRPRLPAPPSAVTLLARRRREQPLVARPARLEPDRPAPARREAQRDEQGLVAGRGAEPVEPRHLRV